MTDPDWLADTRVRLHWSAGLALSGGAIGFVTGSISLIVSLPALAMIAAPFLLIATAAIPAWLLAHQRHQLVQISEQQRAENQRRADRGSGSLFSGSGDGETAATTNDMYAGLRRFAGVTGMMASLPTLLLTVLVLWRSWPRGITADHELGMALAALVLAFPILVAERHISRTSTWSDAPRLAALCRYALAALVIGALASGAHALGFSMAMWGQRLVMATTGMVGIELALRACLVFLLPPQKPELAKIWTSSILADLITSAVRSGGLHERFHIDLSQSWALGFARRIAPLLLTLGVLGLWAASGITTLGLHERGIYERLGRPVAVLKSGLHCHLPWPFAAVRRLEMGVVHDLALGISNDPLPSINAEDQPGALFDRLWDRTHPAESTFVLPGTGAGMRGQAYQLVNSDVRVLWRIGLSDDQAIRSAYHVGNSDQLVRTLTGTLLTSEFSTRTLPQVIGIDRDALCENLRQRLQDQLNHLDSGIELIAVIIDAIHPPPAAAGAYHGVQAATITAATEVSVARSQANRSRHEAATEAIAMLEGRRALAAEILSHAGAERQRFTADTVANQQGGKALTLERWLQALGSALARAQLTIVDHRFSHDDLPLIDLRPTALPGLTKDAP